MVLTPVATPCWGGVALPAPAPAPTVPIAPIAGAGADSLRECRRAGDLERRARPRARLGGPIVGLPATDPDVDPARDDLALLLPVHDAERAIAYCKVDGLAFTGSEVNALEPLKGPPGRAREPHVSQVELHDLVAGHDSGVGDVDGDSERIARRDARSADARVLVGEGGEAFVEAEGVEGLAVVVTID